MLAERQVTVCSCLALQNSCSNKLKAGGTPRVGVRRSSVSINHQNQSIFGERVLPISLGPAFRGFGYVSQSRAVEEFLGIGFHVDTLQGAASSIMEENRTARFHYVATPNVQHVVKILEDPTRIAPLYKSAWRVYCDSRVLSRLACLRGRSLPVVTGSDLTAEVLQRANVAGLKIAVIGPSVDDCAKLRVRYPRLSITSHTPPMGFIHQEKEIAACIDFVKRERAPLVFLAIGMPRQEMLANRLAADKDTTGIGLCIGASIDFLTGKQQRAPLWVQMAGFEWLHRLMSDPIRLGSRYLIECPKIIFLALREFRRSTQGSST